MPEQKIVKNHFMESDRESNMEVETPTNKSGSGITITTLLGIVLVVIASAGFVMGDSHKSTGAQYAVNIQQDR